MVVVSVTEGDEKPLKIRICPDAATLLLINKLDLLPYVRFDVAKCIEHARQMNPELQVLPLSAETGKHAGLV